MKDGPSFLFDFDLAVGNTNETSDIDELVAGHFKVGCIRDSYSSDLTKLCFYDALLVEHSSQVLTRRLVSAIRGYIGHRLFLVPIFIQRADLGRADYRGVPIDAEVHSVQSMKQMMPLLNNIHQKNQKVPDPLFERYDDVALSSLLTFMYSRSIERIEPIVNPDYSSGFYYPVLSELSEKSRIGHFLISVLKRGEEEGLIQGYEHHHSYVCNQCGGGFLHYREVCPSCQSSHIRSHEMVHHFRCAHVAPIRDFLNVDDGDRIMICPKCDHGLKHIGVDYDKPSNIHQCRTCHFEFQQYSVMAKCTHCGHDQFVEQLFKSAYKSFEITQRGIQVVEKGKFDEGISSKQNIEGTIEWSLFRQNLIYDQAKGWDRGYVVKLNVEAIAGLRAQIGTNQYRRLLEELVQIIGASQRDFDYMTFHESHLLYTLLQTKQRQATEIAQRTNFLLNHLLKDNLGVEMPSLTSEVQSLHDMVGSEVFHSTD